MSQKMIFLVVGVLIGAIAATLVVGGWYEGNNNPRLLLLQAAKEHKYSHHLYSVSVPPRALPEEKLREWREYSEKHGLNVDAHHFHPAMEGKIFTLRVNFDKRGTRITGVVIEWWKDEKERGWGFPYQLGEEETKTLVHKAIAMMAESKKRT